MYVAGGYLNQNDVSDKVEYYDFDNKCWEHLPPLAQKLCSSGLVEFYEPCQHYLLSVGGVLRQPNKPHQMMNIV